MSNFKLTKKRQVEFEIIMIKVKLSSIPCYIVAINTLLCSSLCTDWIVSIIPVNRCILVWIRSGHKKHPCRTCKHGASLDALRYDRYLLLSAVLSPWLTRLCLYYGLQYCRAYRSDHSLLTYLVTLKIRIKSGERESELKKVSWLISTACLLTSEHAANEVYVQYEELLSLM